ncbi:MAG: enoyl-CoA hydratase/isomerase family protein [Deltaproteobacteria bacterium]|nr:enoyl-CoA hydratase/isomerase family protein [Deltaproteobacteria bacterium]
MGNVTIEREGAVAVLRLARAPVNALELEFAREFETALLELTPAQGVGAIVLAGSGGCFSAGLDLKRVPFYSFEQQREMVATANRILAWLYGCPLPVVAAVTGHAIAGGLIFVLACDYRVGSGAPCKIGLTEAQVGIPVPAVAMEVLRAEVAPHVARVLALRARNIGPQAALAFGVLDELQPPDRVLPVAIERAHEMAAMPVQGYAKIKRQLRSEALARIEEILAGGTDPMLRSWVTEGAGEAAAALLRGAK